MEQPFPGYAQVHDVIKVDTLVRSVIRDLQDVHDFCDDALYAADQLAGSIERLLKQLDVKPTPAS